MKIARGVDIEIADAEMPDLAVALQLLECGDRVLERHTALPVQQIQVETLGTEPLQTGFAGSDRPLTPGIGRQYLADQKHVVTAIRDGFAHEPFRAPAAVHLGGVDQRQPTFDTGLQCGDFLPTGRGVIAQKPGALTHRRDVLCAGQFDVLHENSL